MATEETRSHLIMVKKRDGTIVEFARDKIVNAIFKAASAVGGHDRKLAESLASRAVAVLEYHFDDKNIPTVEDIQDIVEKVLIKTGHAKTAKTYILYRKQREKLRRTKGTFLEVKGSMDEYLQRTDWRVYENSNSDYSFSGLMSHVAGKIIANYTLNEIYSDRVADAHREADMHIHDLGYGVVGYCSGWSLKNLLLQGFGGVPKKIQSKPPKHLEVAVIQIVNFLGTLQMEHAGAQAFSSVDTLLAPFVKIDKLNYKRVKQNMQMLVFSLNVPSRWSCQAPFTNFTFDWTVPEDMKDLNPVIGGKVQDFTYGDCQEEMKMLNKAFIEVMIEGDANDRTFFYPIPTYNITKDFDWNSENSMLLFEMTSKYGTPYFQNFINSKLKPSDIRSMCCRLQLDLKQLRSRMGGLFGAADQTGSIGVVTINLPRIGYSSKNEEEFFTKLGNVMDIAKESLETKRKIVDNNLKSGLMPFTKFYLGSYRNHFSTIGINGMHEALINLNGKGIATKEGKELALKALGFIRKKLTAYQEETGNLYNLEASPCESATYRFAKEDRKRFEDIVTGGTNEKPYYTNSTHLPVNHTDDVFEALGHQDDMQVLYTGGTVHHCFIGERIDDWKMARKLVRKVAENFNLPYFTITPTFSVCPEHGYISGEYFTCPHHVEGKKKEIRGDVSEVQQENRSVQPDSRVLSPSPELE
jgi:ribonucleoside-triphosphate reductase